MSFKTKDYSVLGYANQFTLWHFRNLQDTVTNLTEPKYFDNVYSMVRPGDMIICNTFSGPAILVVDFVAEFNVVVSKFL